VCFVFKESNCRRLVPREGNSEPGGERGCLGSACWEFLSALHCETRKEVRHTVRVAVVEEDLWCFRRILGDLNDVSISSARAAALERAFSTHSGFGWVVGRSSEKGDETEAFVGVGR